MTEQGPIKEFRVAGITSSVWRNDQAQSDGSIRVRYSVKIQKRFRKKDGEWTNTDYYFPEDLPKLQLVVTKAFEFISLTESSKDDAEEAVPV